MNLPMPPNISSSLRTCLAEIGRRLTAGESATANLAAVVGQTPPPALPVPIEMYEFTLTYAQVAALGATTTGAVDLGVLPAGCFVLTLTSTVTVPFVSASGTYSLTLDINLRSTGHDVTVDSDPYDEAGKIQHVIGSDTHSPYPDGADPDHGVIKAVEVSAFAFNLVGAPARRNYIPTVRAALTGSGPDLETYNAGSVTLRYVVLRPFGL